MRLSGHRVTGLRDAKCTGGAFPDFLPKEMEEVEDPACIAMAKKLQVVDVSMPTEFATGNVGTCFAKTDVPSSPDGHPLLLLHGFDSSCLEWRRLLPELEKQGQEAWAVDILGWGFTQRDESLVQSFSPEAKRAHLRSFILEHIKKPVVLVGASLGGTVAIDMALNHPELVEKLVLVDAQGYIDGAAMTGQPAFMQRFGVNVLKSKPLRMFANKIAYADPDRFGTEDAMRIGRLHCLTDGWDNAMISFMNSGGYFLSERVKEVKKDTLVLWGRQDKILDPKQYAERFIKDIPTSRLEWVEDCGHVPHLEKAASTAASLISYVKGSRQGQEQAAAVSDATSGA